MIRERSKYLENQGTDVEVKFTDKVKWILWDFDKKSGYFLFLLSIYTWMY